MSNELTKAKENLIITIENNDLSKVIKPLVKEIYLFDSYVAGTTYLDDMSVLDNIKVGDWLVFKRESNKFDSNAIIIFTEDKKKIGYVPEKDNIIFARLMDAGKIIKAKVNDISKRGSFKQIKVNIYLLDF